MKSRKILMKVFTILLGGALILLSGCAVHPKPICLKDRYLRAQKDMESMFAHQEPIQGDLTLYEAIARALKYNLHIKVKTAESVLLGSELDLSHYDMLPALAAKAGYVGRTNHYAVRDPNDNTQPSFSQDRDRHIADATASWSILNFGISYLTAKQNADRFLVSVEHRRQVIDNIVAQVRYAYWRALALQNLLHELHSLQPDVQAAVKKSRLIQEHQLKEPLEALQYQHKLFNHMRHIHELRKHLLFAKEELAQLMNLRPGTHFRLASMPMQQPLPAAFHTHIPSLQTLALVYRPELVAQDYQSRIALQDVKKARFGLMPDIYGDVGYHYDSNSFLFNQTWGSYGVHVAVDLMRLLATPSAIRRAKDQRQLADQQRMLVAMGVLSQVEISALQYKEAERAERFSRYERDTDQKIYQQMHHQYLAHKIDHLALVEAKAAKVLSDLRYQTAYAEWQNAGGQLLRSVGFNPSVRINGDESLKQIKQHVIHGLKKLPTLPKSWAPLSYHESKLEHSHPSELAHQMIHARIKGKHCHV